MTLALLITAATGAWAEETLLAEITPANYADYSDIVTITQSGSVTTSVDGIYSGAWGTTYGDGNSGSLTVKVSDNVNFSRCYVRCNVYGETTVTDREFTLNFKCNGSSIGVYYAGGWLGNYGVSSIQIYGTSGPEVTITGTSTEGQQAEFDMPQNDVTVTYTLKRDLSVETQVTVGDGTDGVRYRVQKQGNTFQPVGMDQAQVMALFRVHDQIEDQDLAATEDYTVQIYAVDIEGQPTGDAITFQNFTYAPGQYIVKAQGQGNYTGQTTESNIFTLYQGYEIVVAANEYATYYKDEALYIEDEDAQLYTITAVGKETATATEVTTAAANMPILVKNNSTETKTILLIPTTEQTPDDVTVAKEFKGTLEAKTFTAADMQAADYYVCNGHDFVKVKGEGTIAANRCWIEISKAATSGARRMTISFSDPLTGIESVISEVEDGNWYDLNGRRLDKKPAQKGLFIKNGKKVVVK